MDGLYRATHPDYCCGFVVERDEVVETSSRIAKLVSGATREDALRRLRQDGAEVEFVCPLEPRAPFDDPALRNLF